MSKNGKGRRNRTTGQISNKVTKENTKKSNDRVDIKVKENRLQIDKGHLGRQKKESSAERLTSALYFAQGWSGANSNNDNTNSTTGARTNMHTRDTHRKHSAACGAEC